MIIRWTGPFIIHDVQSNGVVELLNFKALELSKMKTRENRGEKPRHSKIRTTQFSGANFAPPYPFVRNHFCEHFPKACSRSLPKISHALCLGEPQECENFALHYSSCAKFALVL
ncbi:hypothetical protein AAG906_041041 [Vitis piasezkii]